MAQAAPRTFSVVGGGYGHGIGMSQYGAHGMALRGASAGRIISYYYGGAQARPATLPATIRVGLLQADHDPAAGGRLGRVLVKGVEVPGKGGSGRFAVSGLTPGGRKARRSLGGHTTWSIRSESGGTSVFDPSGRRVFGPTRAGTGVVVRFQTALPTARLSLPQTGQQLRWGRLDVPLVRDNRGVGPSGTSTGGFAAGTWRVSNANAEQLSTSARVFASYRWGRAGDLPVVGDWDGDGTQTVGVVRPSAARNSNHFLLRNSDGSVVDFWYGRHGDRLVVGDWNGNGTWTPGILRGGTRWYLKDSFTGAAAKVAFKKQTPGRAVVGDWDNRP